MTTWIVELKDYVAARPSIIAQIGDATDGPDEVRLWPGKLRQRPTLPAATFQMISRPRNEMTHDGVSGLRSPRVQWSCWGKTYDDAHDLAEAVASELDGVTIVLAGSRIACSSVVDELDDYEKETGLSRVIVDTLLRQEEN
jgi:hypothetical protein